MMSTTKSSVEYRLKMQGPQGWRWLRYDPMSSRLVWEDNGERVDLRPVGFGYPNQPAPARKPAVAVSPEEPGLKTRSLRMIKIQLGLKCNYSCQYCNQGGQANRVQGNPNDVADFMAKMPTWFDGGLDGKGKGVRIEFWGGEPLVYFRVLKPLAEAIKEKYPNVRYNIISNLSLLTDDIAEWFVSMGFSVGMSHDGPGYEVARGEDPLKDPEQLAIIKRLYLRLRPQNKFGFNCVLTRKNYSLAEVRRYIGARLGVPAEEIPLSTEEVLLPYSDSGMTMSPRTPEEHSRILQQTFWEGAMGQSLPVGTMKSKCEDFFRSLAEERDARTLGQKCGMDRADNIAVNMKGDVMTCQNTSAEGPHRIGSIETFEDIRLTTATHWSKREECTRCPVVQLCQGACMFLQKEYWKQACDNSFTWNLGVLSVSLYWLTRMTLIEIEGPVLRREELPSKMTVVEINDDIIRLRTGRDPRAAAPGPAPATI